ncbi:hypothetical protein E8E11_005737 [Didymella keratinophila]|nr:hypothetical protein E8E11_005737 [Didymella keratinophila]
MIPGERSTSSRRKPDRKRPEPATTEDFKAAVAKLDQINAMARSKKASCASSSQSQLGSNRRREETRDSSPQLSTRQNTQGRANIENALRTPSKRRRNVVLDSEDEDIPERGLSEGLTLLDIDTSDRHQRKKRATAPGPSSDDEHMSDASPASIVGKSEQSYSHAQNQPETTQKLYLRAVIEDAEDNTATL